MWEYTDKVKELFFNPKNTGVLENANGVGDVGALSCGDALRLMIKVEPETQIITDARFQTFGCGSAIASSSALTELIIGKTIDEAMTITNQDIAEWLGGLPPEKMHCSVMGYEALRAAVANYRGEAWVDDHEEGALICKCFGIDEGMIERTVRTNLLTDPELVTQYTKAAGGCGTCAEHMEKVLARVNEAMVAEGVITAERAFMPGSIPAAIVAKKKKRDAANKAAAEKAAAQKAATEKAAVQAALEKAAAEVAAAAEKAAAERAAADRAAVERAVAKPGTPGKLTNLQRMRIIEQSIEELRPVFKRDGGDCELVDIEDGCVFVKFSGTCVGCQMAGLTIASVQERIIERLGAPMKVIPVQTTH